MIAIVFLRIVYAAMFIAAFNTAWAEEMTFEEFLYEPDLESVRVRDKMPSQLEDLISRLTEMPSGGATGQPIGHYQYCKVHRHDCQPHKIVEVVILDQNSWDLIVLINQRVNGMHEAMSDQEQYGKEEFWTYPDGYADCEDYVLEKRRQLIAYGFPVSSLLITKVMSNGEGHAVLTIRTVLGDIVLDNMTPKVWPWHDLPYPILARQSPSDAGKWESVTDLRSGTMTAASGPF